MEKSPETKLLDVKDPNLWAGVAPEAMWERYKAHLHLTVDAIFRADRPRAVVKLRPEPTRESSGLGA